MAWHQRLRFRLLGIQLLVVIIGISLVLLISRIIMFNVIRDSLRAELGSILDVTALALVEKSFQNGFQNAILSSVLIAGVGALIVGIGASWLLWQTLVIPLRKFASSSQKIADGDFGERVPFPHQSGEAMQRLANNFNNMASRLQMTEQERVVLIGNVSHELRTPLSGLKGMVEGLEDGVFEDQIYTFQMMGREIDRLTKLVEDLQNLSLVEGGNVPLNNQSFLLCEVAAQIVLYFQEVAKQKQITIEVDETPIPIQILADRDRTVQIVTNLVSNAIRYTQSGGDVLIKLDALDKMGRLMIVDSGVGISTGDLPFVFERFFRADRSRSRQSGGTGIGLTIALHLARAMGGNLTATSDGMGKGATFILELPQVGIGSR